MTDLLAETAAAVRQAAARSAHLPVDERSRVLFDLLTGPVHQALMRARTDGGERVPDALGALARTLRERLPDDAVASLPVRPRVLIALLRRDALEPAWTLAHDNASGRVRPSKVTATWAGGTFLTTALPLPTFVEDGHVYAWLPGFRDPRWDVPDDVYVIDGDVTLQHRLDRALMRDGALELSGIGFLSELVATPDDIVTIHLTGPGDARHAVPAVRGRRPDLVAAQEPELTRLAWGGWHAECPLAPLAATPGRWLARIEVTTVGVGREEPLGTRSGPLGDPARFGPLTATRDGATIRCDRDASGQLLLEVTRP